MSIPDTPTPFRSCFAIFGALFLFLPRSAAQPVLSAATHQPAFGDVSIRHYVNSASVSEGADGANQTWIFSSLQWLNRYDTVEYRLPYPTEVQTFPQANLALDECDPEEMAAFGTCNPVQQFFRNFADSTWHLGWVMPAAADNGPSTIIDDPAKVMQFPFNYTDSFTDSLEGDFYGFAVFHYLGANTVTATGYGSLQLPGYFYPSVLKVVEDDTVSPNFPAKPWHRAVHFFSPDCKFPMLSILYYPSETVVWTTESACNPNAVKTLLSRGETKVFPQPARETVQIAFELEQAGPGRLSVFNLLNQKVMEQALPMLQPGRNEISLNLYDLPAGAYFFRLETGKGQALSGRIHKTE